MTGTDLQTRVLARVGDDPAAPVFYTAAEALSALNEAQRLFCLLTLCLETSGTLALAAGQAWYHLLDTFADWIVPLRIRISGTGGEKVHPVRLTEMDSKDPNWQAAIGAPGTYACLGCDLVAFDQHPSASGTSLTVIYARAPVDITAGTSPEIPEEYHPALIDYAIPRLRAKEGGQEFQKVLPMFQDFLEAAKKMAAYVRARSLAQGYDNAPPESLRYDPSREVKRNA